MKTWLGRAVAVLLLLAAGASPGGASANSNAGVTLGVSSPQATIDASAGFAVSAALRNGGLTASPDATLSITLDPALSLAGGESASVDLGSIPADERVVSHLWHIVTPTSCEAKTYSFTVAVAQLGLQEQRTVTAQTPCALDLKKGDLLVGGASLVDGFGNTAGGMFRVRGSTPSLYCASPASSFDPDFWNEPQSVSVDSSGRVVFLAPLQPGWGLFRCSSPGQPPEKLAVFPSSADVQSGFPVPFPNTTYENVGELHIEVHRIVTIDAAVNGGKPTLSTQSTYTMAVRESGGFTHLVTYDPASGEWDNEPPLKIVDPAPGREPCNLPQVAFHSGAVFSACDGTFARFSAPLTARVSGKIAGVSFDLRAGLFGGFRQVAGATEDDLAKPNVDSGCKPPPPVQSSEPSVGGTYAPFSSIEDILYDEWGSSGFVATSGYGPSAPYLENLSEILLDDDSSNDQGAYYSNSGLGCQIVSAITFNAPIPFFDPLTGAGNGSTAIAAGPNGLFGIKFQGNRVFSVGSDSVTTVATLCCPTSIATWPAKVSAGIGAAIVIKINSPVDVLVTAPDGKRFGVDASGAAVNELGQRGYVGDPGEPRLLAIRDPIPGHYAVEAIGTGAGPYGLDVYGIDSQQPVGSKISTSGTTQPGESSAHDFTLAADGTLAFDGGPPPPPPTDTQAPTVQCAAPDGAWHAANVALACTAGDGGSGLASAADASFSLATAVPPGSEDANAPTATRSVCDLAGNCVSAGPIAGNKVDRKPPSVSCAAADGAWHAANVALACTAGDGGSGLASAADASFSLATAVPAGSENANAPTDTRAVCDLTGNCVSAGPIGGNRVDRKPPGITLAAPTASTYTLGEIVAASYSCADGGSGLASCAGPAASGSPIDTASVGTKVFTVAAKDAVGNSAARPVSYAVAYGICLLFEPTQVKSVGSTIPVKLQLCSATRTNLSSPLLTVTALAVDFGPVLAAGGANPGNVFRYDPTLGTSGGYIYNLKTTGLTPGSHTFSYKAAGDPSTHMLTFQLR